MTNSHHLPIPPEKDTRTLILCDFDGTVSTRDTVNRLIRDHVESSEWRFHFKRYLRGELGSRGVYEAVAPLMKMTPGDLSRFVQGFALLDPAFPMFLDWARDCGIDVKIVSDGFDATIRELFRYHGLNGIDIFSNRLVLADDGVVEIGFPHEDPGCGICGTCKLGVIGRFRSEYDKIILIGDGESDRHAAHAADRVLALKDLFQYCAREGIPALRVDGFNEVPWLLTRRMEAVIFDMDGTLVESLDSIAEAFNHMLGVLGYPLMTKEEVARKTIISLKDFTANYLKPGEQEEGVRIFRAFYDGIYLQRTKVLPGVEELLGHINETAVCGVITNKKGAYARRLVEHLGLAERLPTVIGAEDGFKAKPSGDMIREFVRRHGVSLRGTIYVGDTPVDVQAAANGGVDSYAVANEIFSPEELALSRPRRVLRNINELADAVRPIISGCPGA
ncbi:MAG: HAD-IB family phosphatase [Pseudomonadota bacterium]